jgi:7,8-dihydropterin-6-yl-methyl-4-(beta-D-ribofuranosyl)aminobenzene 5'-phosphate synthase
MSSAETVLTILVDDQARTPMASEHGFALWIQTGRRRILFDTGQGAALPGNAERLGIDLSTADIVVLSHGHYDHGGGLPHVLGRNRTLAVYAHPRVLRSRFAIEEGDIRPVHLPNSVMEALRRHPNVHWVRREIRLGTDIGLTGPIPRPSSFEDPGGPFFLDPAGRFPDAIDDELALWIGTPAGLIVCVGCAHAGLINTLHLARQQSGINRIAAVIGGFHLGAAAATRIVQTVETLHDFAPQRLVPCHCTGRRAIQALQSAFGDRVAEGFAGDVWRV